MLIRGFSTRGRRSGHGSTNWSAKSLWSPTMRKWSTSFQLCPSILMLQLWAWDSWWTTDISKSRMCLRKRITLFWQQRHSLLCEVDRVSINEHREFWLYGVSFNSEFFHLTFGSNILQLNCYDIFIFYLVYRNVIINVRITTILSHYMNQSLVMIIQNFIILSFIISYLVCDQEWILYIIIFRSLILWNQGNSISQKLCKMKW